MHCIVQSQLGKRLKIWIEFIQICSNFKYEQLNGSQFDDLESKPYLSLGVLSK